MKVFTCTNFEGHYGVGTSAIIVAPTLKRAKQLLEEALENDGLHFNGDEEINEVPLKKSFCELLNNGEY